LYSMSSKVVHMVSLYNPTFYNSSNSYWLMYSLLVYCHQKYICFVSILYPKTVSIDIVVCIPWFLDAWLWYLWHVCYQCKIFSDLLDRTWNASYLHRALSAYCVKVTVKFWAHSAIYVSCIHYLRWLGLLNWLMIIWAVLGNITYNIELNVAVSVIFCISKGSFFVIVLFCFYLEHLCT